MVQGVGDFFSTSKTTKVDDQKQTLGGKKEVPASEVMMKAFAVSAAGVGQVNVGHIGAGLSPAQFGSPAVSADPADGGEKADGKEKGSGGVTVNCGEKPDADKDALIDELKKALQE